MLVFKGIQKTTLIDFPNRVACTLFLPKCNFRCPFCYNRQLVFDEGTGTEINEKDALDFLSERKGFLDGVCITGGEPLLHSGLVSFCKKAKALGLLVKVDTNGSMPGQLKNLLDENAVDYVAMDIKGAQSGYSRAAGVRVDLKAISESIRLLRHSKSDYEFRMTVVPGLHSRKDILEIGAWLDGSRRFFLQNFNSGARLIDPALEKTKPYSASEMQGFAADLKPFFEEVKVRGF